MVGQLDLTRSRVDGLPVVTAVAPNRGREGRYAAATLRQTPRILRFQSRPFGPYPFDAMGGVTPAAEFNGAVYDRGPMTMQALRTRIHDPAFSTVLKSWAADHRCGHGSVPSSSLAEQVSGADLGSFFDGLAAHLAAPRAHRGERVPSGLRGQVVAGRRAGLVGADPAHERTAREPRAAVTRPLS